MNFKLINEPDSKYDALSQVLHNRGIADEDMLHYINPTENDIASPLLLGEDKLAKAVSLVEDAIRFNKDVLIIVDSDCDGFTSAALLSNYLYDINPEWVNIHLHHFLHSGKEHGLNDLVIDDFVANLNLIILPDAGSNDIEYHKVLDNIGVACICLDHHNYDENVETSAIIINSQCSTYPNKELSGVGVTWQFCKYYDSVANLNYADDYLDLVALGDAADMMSLTSIETKYLVTKGFRNVKNPFIDYLAEKNDYSIQKKGGLNYDSAGWYIAPFVNAIVRSGTMEEKQNVFNSMLKYRAFEEVLSNKRGHKPGEMEKLVVQVMRTTTNVKNRQQKAVDAGMALLEKRIEANNMLDHKVLLFILEGNEIEATIRGLSANKLMGKYQRPVCVLSRTVQDEEVIYQGSARGCEVAGIENFMAICEKTGLPTYCVGHDNAFGLGLKETDIEQFLIQTDELLKDISGEPTYYCDYVFSNRDVDGDKIIDIATHPELWGKDMNEPIIGIKGLQITKEMLTLMAKNTLKIQVTPNVSLIKFSVSDEEFQQLYSENGSVEINVVGTCNANEWMGNVSAQLMITDLEIIDKVKWVF